MMIWKLVSAYCVPALILISLFAGHFLSQLGLLEEWLLGENESLLVISLSPAVTPGRGENQMQAAVTANKWPASNEHGNPDDSRFDGAEKHDWRARAYEDSVKTAHRTAQAYFNHALDHMNSGRLEDAIQAYEQALLHQPNFPAALLNLGALHYRRKSWQQARQAFENAARLDNDSEMAHFNLALAHAKLGQWDKAERAARRALASNNRNAATYNLLGLLHTLQGDYEAAISVYKQGLAVNASDADLRSNLSLAYRKMARATGAKKKFDSIEEL